MLYTILLTIFIYILGIFICRYSYRQNYKWGNWIKSSSQIEIIWFIPLVNIFGGAAHLLLGYNQLIKNKKSKYKFINWFTNRDL